MSAEPPFYREEMVEFEWFKGRSFKAAKTNSENLWKAAHEKGISIYEISRVGERYSKLSAFKLLVKVKSDLTLPLEVVYQYAKLWEGEPESVPLNSLPSSKQGVKKSRAAKKEAKERGKDKKLVGFQINFGDGVKIDFPNKPEDSFFNWLYIMALRQDCDRNRKLHERLLRLIEAHPQQPIGFSDIFFAPHSKKVIRYNCQARAVAQYLSIYRFRKEKVQEVFPQRASLYDIRDQLRHFYDEFVHLVYPLHTESSNPIVPASHSVKSASSSVKPNNMAASETRNAQSTSDSSTKGDQLSFRF